MYVFESFAPAESDWMSPDDVVEESPTGLRTGLRTVRLTDAAAYQWLPGCGFKLVEAANLVAFRRGLKPVRDGWTPSEIRDLLSLRRLVAQNDRSR
jgi:hypothetical protein